ncbi:MAG TPA: glycogen debranching N-terminal domain-containing protein [Acidimicrobiales bacterium]|nr:glycogen debranching N-terminal domain-containing protein [Acidimicrobiales bacterium]
MNDQLIPSPGARPEAADPKDISGQPHLQDLVTAVRAPAMSLSGADGQIRSGGAQGIFVNDVRALSRLELLVDGNEPLALGFDAGGGPSNRFDSAVVPSGRTDPAILIERHRSLTPHGANETFLVKTYAPPAIAYRLELRAACDLADIATVKGGLPTGPPLEAVPVEGGLAWELAGKFHVEVSSVPSPAHTDPARGSLFWDLQAGPATTITLSVRMSEEAWGAPVDAAPEGSVRLSAPKVGSDDHRLQKLLDRSLCDLDALRMVSPEAPGEVFLAAGAPWFLTMFGRDSLWAARMLLPVGTDIALGTLRALARRQGTSTDSLTGEQPGKILHEVRREPRYDDRAGVKGNRHFLPPVYYGTVDATALWVCVLHDTWRWGAPEAEVAALLDPLERCLTWLDECGKGPDGFITYVDESGRGLSNQGWKDSFNGVQFRDGRLAHPPIGLCEVQGYAYEAAMGGADMLEAFGRGGARRWRDFAHDLAERFRANFWVADRDGPFPAIAVQADGRPVDSVTSNIGHLLGTGILNADEAEVVAARLGSPRMDCGFGLRTLSSASAGFNPMSYHCGSVWAHDTAIAICGLMREGGPVARQTAGSLVEGLLSAGEGFQYRLPELYSGADRNDRSSPLPYPAACRPQAWSAAASVAVLSALIGVRPDVPGGRLAVRPLHHIGAISVDGLRVGGQTVAVEVSAHGTRVSGLPAGIEVQTGATAG